jgi:hypothetical protein
MPALRRLREEDLEVQTETSNSQAPVAHTCNPSYSGGRDQENQGSKPAQSNISQDPTLKKPNTKIKGLKW